ncbi:MCR_0457 family protein [Acinetobacter portensis]|uniref:MCR_0457 family protein n=1 Tax=Acinetobacter portensis TaxID=1839785 RepID=UPI0016517533|nr:hypothetical protein [Acinetobacter portensis]
MQLPIKLGYSFCLAITLAMTQSIHATTDLSLAEKNSIIKEDVASAQIMQEVCPTLIGKNAKFDQNIKNLISEYLADYSDKNISLEKLKLDAEYKILLQEAREALKDASQEENQFACTEVSTIEM